MSAVDIWEVRVRAALRFMDSPECGGVPFDFPQWGTLRSILAGNRDPDLLWALKAEETRPSEAPRWVPSVRVIGHVHERLAERLTEAGFDCTPDNIWQNRGARPENDQVYWQALTLHGAVHSFSTMSDCARLGVRVERERDGVGNGYVASPK